MIFRTTVFATIFLAIAQFCNAAIGDEGERRIALVIGVSAYESIPRLANTINDANLMAKTLTDLEFEVTLLENPNLSDIRTTLSRFAFQAETSDIAMVYFAGHGLEIAGENYLVPSDSNASSRADVAASAVPLSAVLAAVDRARQLRVVVLDSCRDDPFGTLAAGEVVTSATGPRSTQEAQTSTTSATVRGLSGLAEPSPDRGTLVAFAAEAGRTALDGNGRNSPYTIALAQNLKAPDVEIGLVFRRVRDSVLQETKSRQVPHTYGSLSGNPYFLAGRSADANLLENEERKGAWARLDVAQVDQLQSLADDGDLRALKGLAYMRLDPNAKGFDPAGAAGLLQRATDQDDPEAMYELARLYETGIGVEQDTLRAVKLYKAAAALDFADATNDLGFLTFQGGLGITRNVPKALEYFSTAAALGHPEAMYNFAALIDDGLVKDKTLKDAAQLLYRSLRSGNEDVLTQLLESPTMFKREVRAELQRLLIANEFYAGSVDASFGPATKRGLRKAYGLEN